uniref:F-box domain-containing protein n=1 Tax=Oryza glumipatula TaxID=40148 RepID=A0A0E0B7J2_9ORYZ
MRSTRRHPLHDAIDAARWDAEPPLGRLVVVAHAASLHASFVPYSAGGRLSASRRPLPDEISATASSLSLLYTVPDLLRQTTTQRRRSRAETAVLRLCAHGDHVVFYGHWACIDALRIAPVHLSGGLDATAHALAADGDGLWKKLTGGLARRLFVDMCRKNSRHLPPRLTSLPPDLQEDILRRLAVEDIAAVYFTCTGLRDLIAGSEAAGSDEADDRAFPGEEVQGSRWRRGRWPAAASDGGARPEDGRQRRRIFTSEMDASLIRLRWPRNASSLNSVIQVFTWMSGLVLTDEVRHTLLKLHTL